MESAGFIRGKRLRSSPRFCRKKRKLENNEKPPLDGASEDECVICKEKITHRSFSNACSHTFCFCCLLKWSLEKTECPLCKKEYENIMHNINENTYANYFVPTTKLNYHYPSSRLLINVIISRISFYRKFLTHRFAPNRMSFEPHLVFLNSSLKTNQLPNPFRQKVYEQRLFVKVPSDGALHLATSDFYEQYPSYFPRLITWLHRELTSLWPDNEIKVAFMLDLIMSLFVKYSVFTMEFLCLLKPYMYCYCNHFVHEFYAFAISRHEMEMYDAQADYGLSPLPTTTDSAAPTSSEQNTSVQRQRRRRKQKQPPQPLNMVLRKREEK